MIGAMAVSGLKGGHGAPKTDEGFRVAGAEGRGRRRGEQSAARTGRRETLTCGSNTAWEAEPRCTDGLH
jgi:hypothetical protein